MVHDVPDALDHATLEQVVWVQFVLMAVLFVVLVAWDLGRYLYDARAGQSRLAHAG